ncbi:hypothetical protein FA13DRAFT_961209 [Coprinellus micaceus]|uniref:F-box domain-containing protein n=1 Tax=Coprinellus micaceus TaxID=71717 RepID=A0A4Y7SZA1_COPMI|nr:hypothetical protein FA13DRAFT_961209 [Coprinellus micaceus]
MTSDAPSFECIGLPGDLWIEVALDADPLDVMSLSQTCRILHSLLSEGSVWKAILRKDMRRNGPFIVSYSLDELTLGELQRAATRSERWRRFSIKRALSPGAWNMDATLETGKSLRDCSDVRPTNANLTQRLIPGGRFLLTSGVSNPYYDGESTAQMTLWDLGPHNSHPGLKSIPVASSVVARGFPPYQRVRLDVDLCVADETRLTIAASFSAGGEGART